MCMSLLADKKIIFVTPMQENNFWQNYSILDLDDFQARFQ